jgi:hypothetical protein
LAILLRPHRFGKPRGVGQPGVLPAAYRAANALAGSRNGLEVDRGNLDRWLNTPASLGATKDNDCHGLPGVNLLPSKRIATG